MGHVPPPHASVDNDNDIDTEKARNPCRYWFYGML